MHRKQLTPRLSAFAGLGIISPLMGLKTGNSSVLRFGSFELDVSGGQLRKSGVRLKLRPQAFRVLTLLANRSGELVTREEIRQQIWDDDSFVDFDQSLNFCIRQVRNVLGDDAVAPRFIETIPRRGYRFLVPVAVLPAPTPMPVVTSKAAPRKAITWLWAIAVLVQTAAILLWYNRPHSPPRAWRSIPLTTYPGSERNPSLSPSGQQVAFTWDGEAKDNFDIYLKSVDSGAPVRLTTHPAEDVSPAWSPDGHTLAFLRRFG